MNKKIIIGIIVIILAIIFSLTMVWLNITNIPSSEDYLIVKNSGGQSILIAECADPSYIENTSDYIIEGEIISNETKWVENTGSEGKNIYTYSEFKISNYIKGEPLGQKMIQIVTMGGCIGEICQNVEDSPTINIGRKRLYLTETNGEFMIHGCGGIIDLKSNSPSQEDCDRKNFSMAFILATNTESEITQERINKLNSIKNAFSNEFYLATRGLATMDTSYQIFTISKEDLIDTSVQTISKKFYESNPDNFDFISVFAVKGFSFRGTSHDPAQRRINGIGSVPWDGTADFGSAGRLLGVNYDGDIDIQTQTGALLHETGHHWCCFVGENFDPENSSQLGILQQSMHFFYGLESPYQCWTPMNSQYWVPNGNGTYTQSKECLEPKKYHPFQLYFMGLYDKTNFDFNKKFTVYYSEFDMESKAVPYKHVSINDIISVEGERTCYTNPNSPPPSSSTIK